MHDLTTQYSKFPSTDDVMVKWGVTSGVYDTTVKSTSSYITKGDMRGAPANSTGWRDLGVTHTAILTGMAALGGTPIYYIFGDFGQSDDMSLISEEMIFHVPTPKGKELAHR